MPKGYKRATEKRHQTGCLSDIKTLSNDRVKNTQVMARFSLHQLSDTWLLIGNGSIILSHNLSDQDDQ